MITLLCSAIIGAFGAFDWHSLDMWLALIISVGLDIYLSVVIVFSMLYDKNKKPSKAKTYSPTDRDEQEQGHRHWRRYHTDEEIAEAHEHHMSVKEYDEYKKRNEYDDIY